MKKTFSKHIMTADIKFCAAQGGGKIGANVSLAFDNAPYVRIQCLKDRICFTPAKKVKNDGCFYSKYVRNQARIFIPRPILDCYRTESGRTLIGESVERIIIDGGYAAKVIQVKECSFMKNYISFENKKFADAKSYKEKSVFFYKDRISVLPAFLNKYKRTDYLKVDIYFGKTAGAVITPIEDIPSDIPSKKDIVQWYGTHLQYCCAPHVSFWTIPSANIIPSHWYKSFVDYENREFSISINLHDESVLVQMKAACIVDGATTRSAEHNSGEKYVCSECNETGKIYDEELLSLIEKVISMNESMKTELIEKDAEIASLKSEIDRVEREKAILIEDDVKKAEGLSIIRHKLLKQEIARRDAKIQELRKELENTSPVPIIDEIKLTDFNSHN